jgi:hypothetical protein
MTAGPLHHHANTPAIVHANTPAIVHANTPAIVHANPTPKETPMRTSSSNGSVWTDRAELPRHAHLGFIVVVMAIVGLSWNVPVSAVERPDADWPARELTVPEWVYEGFLSVQAGQHRYWTPPPDAAKIIAERQDPKTADRLDKQGIRFAITSGLIGAGLKDEWCEIENNRALSAALRAKGIRQIFYLNTIGMMHHEIFRKEVHESVDWTQRLPNGEFVTYYGDKEFRVPCLNNDDLLTYTKNQIRTVMKELKPDGIFTDNFGYYSYTCHCQSCQKKFREYLKKHYPDAASRKARFGAPDALDAVKPPLFQALGSGVAQTQIPESNLIVDPVAQEWVRFRCQRLGDVAAEYDRVIKDCNPQAIWFINYLYGGTPGLNCAVFHGSWPADVYPNADLISAEVSGPPQWSAGGVAKGRTLTMKVTKHFGIPLSTCYFQGSVLANWKRLFLAEGMAFNTAPMDLCGDIWRDDPPGWMRDYLNFYQAHRKLVGRAPTVADCAVLHNFETLSYCTTYPQESLVLCEQSLVQGGVTFDIIFDQDINQLQKYRCLVLANVVAMSQKTAEKIAGYVRNGGSIVVTDDTSALDERMLPWSGQWAAQKSHRLAELLGLGSQWGTSQLLLKDVGKGKVAVIPAVNRPWSTEAARGEARQEVATMSRSTGSHSHGPGMPMVLGVESLSPNHAEILKAVDYALGGARTIHLQAPKEIISEVTQNASGIFVHLLNWNEAKPVDQVKVSLLAPADRKISKVELLSPDRETPAASLPFELKDGRIEFTVSRLVCYDIIVLN